MIDRIRIKGAWYDRGDKSKKPPRLHGLSDWIWREVDRYWTAYYDECVTPDEDWHNYAYGLVKSEEPQEHA